MVKAVPRSVVVVAIVLVAVTLVFMLLPLAVIVGASFTEGQFVSFPPEGFGFRWYKDVLTSEKYLRPALTSLTTAGLVTVFSVVIGAPAAIALARFRFPGSNAIGMLFLSPLVIPTILLGIGLLLFVSSLGVRPSLPVLVMGHLVITIPYVIRTVMAVLADADRFAEEAARTMGARWYERYWFVVLPQAWPGIAAGAFFAFNISFDEAVIALFLRSPQLVTLPIRIYGELEFSTSPSIAAVSSLMIFLTVGLLFAIERFLGIRRVVG